MTIMVSLSNLQRQIIHRTEAVGVGKAANAGAVRGGDSIPM